MFFVLAVERLAPVTLICLIHVLPLEHRRAEELTPSEHSRRRWNTEIGPLVGAIR